MEILANNDNNDDVAAAHVMKTSKTDTVQITTGGNENVLVRAPFVTQMLRAGFAMSIVCVVLGVALHIAEYATVANKSGYIPQGTGMGSLEVGGMVLVTCGVVAAAVFMFSLHDVAALHRQPKNILFTPAYFDLLQNANWTWMHTKICLVLLLAVTIDLMKPPTISFIMPGLLAEYKITKQQGSVLPTLAITGTTMGSILWGYVCVVHGHVDGCGHAWAWQPAPLTRPDIHPHTVRFMSDRVGRRYAILLSTVLFVATSICGAMPNFGSNVFMCWLMGVSVGGLIPVAVSLLSEVRNKNRHTHKPSPVADMGPVLTFLPSSLLLPPSHGAQVMPSRIRTKALITVLSAGSAFGYLAASGFSYLLQTWFAWRTLWFVGLPTGLLMLPLSLGIPESFRFLVVAGRVEEACVSLSAYFGIECTPTTLRHYFTESEPLAGADPQVRWPAWMDHIPSHPGTLTAPRRRRPAATRQRRAPRCRRRRLGNDPGRGGRRRGRRGGLRRRRRGERRSRRQGEA